MTLRWSDVSSWLVYGIHKIKVFNKKSEMKKISLLILLLALIRPVFAIDPFTITDIQVEGLERLEAGTVFNYLPLKVGDEANDEEVQLSIKALFKTGFFNEIYLERDGTTLIVKVVERPSIASVTIIGNDELKTEIIEEGLEQAGIVEGRIFNNAVLERVEQDIKNIYLSLGRYSTVIDVASEELDQNRVAIKLDISEGRVARIKKINIIGTEKESVKSIKKEMKLKEKRGYRLFSRQDQYSKQELEADLERIRSYYQNRGYHEFEIISSNVDITPNKQNIFISITINEGDVHTFGEAIVEGVDTDELKGLQELITIETGESFSREVVNRIRVALFDHFADDGFAFVEINPVFDRNDSAKTVDTIFSIIKNQRVYVRRIDISGNQYTRDEVIRRELRQFEGAWYSASAVRRSKDRLQRMGIFESVQIETPAVGGTTDQVDMKVVVVERDTGSILFSAGYSDEDGVLFGAEFEQRNLLGTGKDLAVKFNNSDAVNVASISYTNPYHTPDGISRSFDLSVRKIDSQEVDTAEYVLDTSSLGVRYRVPVAETNTVDYGFSYERIDLESTSETPPEFLTVIDENPTSDNVLFTIGLSKDTRDDFFFPTRGTIGSIALESTAPGSDFEYYKINLHGSWYYSVASALTLKGFVGIGYGDGYGDSKESGLPFFKNYFAGGARSVRGYNGRSLGPVDSGPTPEPVGGDTRVLLSLETLFPPFGSDGNDKRFGLFVDGGMVYDTADSVDLGQLRYTTGLFFNWFSAIGPFSISYGFPLNEEAGDDIEELQISIGTVFR